MQKYTYSLSANFGGTIYINSLKSEILASAIVSVCVGVNVRGDIVDIYFDTALTSGDNVILLNVIATHNSINTISQPYTKTTILIPRIDTMTNSTYVILATYLLDGYKNTISSIVLNSYKESDTTNYTIQVLDYSRTLVIAQAQYTNSDPSSSQVMEISNIPSRENTIIQIRGKTNLLNKKAYLKSIIFKFI